MKAPEMIEGPEAYQHFENAMRAALAVPRAVVLQRIEAQRKQADLNPRKRGPKRKVTSSASVSPDPAV